MAIRRSKGRLAAAILGLGVAAAAPGARAQLVCDEAVGDPAEGTPEWTQRDADNVSCGYQRYQDAADSPAFQAKRAEQELIEEQEFATVTAVEWAAEPNRQHVNCCASPQSKVGDPFRSYEEWADAGRGRHMKFYFINSGGAKLRARLLAPLDDTQTYPALTFTPGLQSYNEVNAWFPQGLAEAGYVVMIIDPQGQGDSENCGHNPDGSDTFDCPSSVASLYQNDTRSALDFILSTPAAPHPWALGSNADGTPSFNPWWQNVDPERVGVAGHSYGAIAVTPLGQLDERVDAIVAYDNLDASLGASVPRRVPTLFFATDYAFPATPTAKFSNPDPDGHLGGTAYAQLAAAGVDAMSITPRASDHYEWGYQPFPANFPSSRYGERVSFYYTLAWFDRYLKGSQTALSRLVQPFFDGSADAHSIGAGTYDAGLAAANPTDPYAGNVPYMIEGKCAANLLSFYYRSAYSLESGAFATGDMRATLAPQCLESTLSRRDAPVVLQESQPDATGWASGGINVALPAEILGTDPGALVAFRWEAGAWVQIPVQVDEREVMDLNRIYTDDRPGCSDPCYNTPSDGVVHPEFTDPGTFVGPDGDATLDADDEVAFMAFDAGAQAATSFAPPGVDPSTAVEVRITDPLDSGVGYVYLFASTSGHDPSAGLDYVDYSFELDNGPYKTGAYSPTGTAPGEGMNYGPRPETSFVSTDAYHRGFTDRWFDNELRVFRGGATGVDILDRHDDQFDQADLSCIRTQETFRRGEGAFVANVDGPVRAIRDFIGANSGPHVQRQHVFYASVEVINTYLRVHAIPGVYEFLDYSADGVGLVYQNGIMTPGGIVNGTPPGGVVIDGSHDSVVGAGAAGVDGFESIDGPQGGLAMPQRLLTNNADPTFRFVYRDGNPLGQRLCTGDDNELYGASGFQLNTAIDNTDEATGAFTNLFYQRWIHYEAPGEADGPQRLAEMLEPLDLTLTPVALPEPSRAFGLGVALPWLAWLKRRRARRRSAVHAESLLAGAAESSDPLPTPA